MSISWRVQYIALGGGISVNTAFAARKAAHGNDRVWKAWKAMKPASHPPHTLWKSLRDSHIPTANDWIYIFSCLLNSNHRHRKGLATDVLGPQRNACPGTLTPARPGFLTQRIAQELLGRRCGAGTRSLRNSRCGALKAEISHCQRVDERIDDATHMIGCYELIEHTGNSVPWQRPSPCI
jgi:hypothetical protein